MTKQLFFFSKVLTSVIICFAIMRGILLMANWNYFSSLSTSQILLSFAHGIRFDLAIMVALLSLPLLLTFIPFLQKTMSWLIFIIIVIACLGLLMDVAFFQEVHRHVGSELLLLQDIIPFLFAASASHLSELLALLFFIVLFGMAWKKWVVPDEGFLTTRLWKKISLFPIVIILMIIVIRGGLVTGRPLTVIDAYITDSSELANLTLNGIYTGIRVSLSSRNVNNYNYSHFSSDAIQDELSIPEAYPFEQSYPSHNNVAMPNIIVLTIESLNYDYIDALSNKSYGVTPYLDSLTKKSMVFENFFAAGQRSVIGLQATWTGIPALLGFPVMHTGLSTNKITQIAKVARNNNYATFFAQTSKRSSFKVDSLAKSIGFDKYWGLEDIGELLLDYPAGPPPNFGYDYETLMLLKKHLKRSKKENPNKPILAGFFSGTMHAPYTKLPKKFEKYPHQVNGLNGMLNSIAYTDWSIQQFIEGLLKDPEFKNTIFLITADHTSNNFSKHVSYQDLFHIPMIIYAPSHDDIKIEHNKTIRSQLDIMPTIMDLIGSKQAFSALGSSLFKPSKHPVFNNIGYLVGTINNKGYLKTDLSKVAGTDLQPDKVKRIYRHFLMINQRVAKSLKTNKWAH